MKSLQSKLAIILLVLLFGNLEVQSQTTYILSNEYEIKVDGTSTVSDWSVEAVDLIGDFKLIENFKKEVGASFYSNLTFSFPVESMESGRGPIMNSKVETALKSEINPTVNFSSKQSKIISISDSIFVVESIGVLDVAGVKKEITVLLDCTNDLQDNNFSFKGNKDITMSMFDIVKPTAFFGKLQTMDELNVKFEMSFIKE